MKKMPIYARVGVSNLWLVDPIAQSLEVYGLENGCWVVLVNHGGDENVRVVPFAEVELELARWRGA